MNVNMGESYPRGTPLMAAILKQKVQAVHLLLILTDLDVNSQRSGGYKALF